MTNHAKYQRLLDACRGLPPMPTAVVHPCDEAAIEGAIGAARLGLIKPILVGPKVKVRIMEMSGPGGPRSGKT